MITVYKPKLYTHEILKELEPVLNSGWVGLGPKVKEFEEALTKKLNVEYFSALNSCTSALHIAIKLLNLKPGSKILTTPITFVSTNHAILYEGMEPVFCDVEALTGNMDADLAEEAIKKYDISAILLVHNGGYPADLNKFNALRDKYNIPIIEDCAHAFGAQYYGKKIGDSDNICVWSFQAVKNLCTGDGGGLSTNNEEYFKRANILRWLGIDRDTISRSSGGYNWKYDVAEVGFKYHMCDIMATIGLVQLRHIDEDNMYRRHIAKRYYKEIKNYIKPDYKILSEARESSFWFAPIFVENQEKIYNKLVENEIYPSVHFMRNDNYKMYKDCIKINDCKNADWYQNHVLSLPLHLYLTENEISKIIEIVNDAK
jgi:dTDP-4-amino-4,6-dideoxygalactose transaminase